MQTTITPSPPPPPPLQVKWSVPNHTGGVIGSPCGGEFDLRWGQIKDYEIRVC